ncbi:MAG: hypothetical protein A4E49_02391 [Methanosaeta sp. PtaU1.Bin112]|nr:MAG: hypothetical protein A4E49_02391 [Methanosaeta sp. PtaU1.Bin112]
MKYSISILVGMLFLLSIIALASHASAECASCMKEGDWSESANAFINGQPISDEPIAFGPKVVRKTTSQFENQDKATDAAGQSGADASAELILKSIKATPAKAYQASIVKITAAFALNGSTSAEEQTELQLTATATIKDSAGKEVEKLNLIKTSGNEYSKDWTANVPPGIYSVDIAASSLEAAGNFANAMLIEVVSSGNSS